MNEQTTATTTATLDLSKLTAEALEGYKFKFWLPSEKKMTKAHTLPEIVDIWKDYHISDAIPLRQVGVYKEGEKGVFLGDVVRHGESIRFIEVMGGNTVCTTLNCKTTILLSHCGRPEFLGNIFENEEYTPARNPYLS